MDIRTEEARPVRLENYRPPDWLVETVELDVSLDPTATRVRAALALRPASNGVPPAPLVLDGDGLVLKSLMLDGHDLPAEQYVATADRLTIAQPPPRAFRLEIETVIDPSANTQLLGLYRSGTIYCTQCEAEGFRRITYFPDRPDVMAVYTTRIEADRAAAPMLLANGNLVESGEVPGTDRHFAVWHDPFPKPSYLFALVGGTLACVEDRFRTMSGREVTLRIYVEPGKEPRCLHAMDSLKRAMRWDETAFGREYDLDIFMIVAVSDFNMGAMENKGLTVFRDQEFTADERSRAVERISDVRGLRAHQFVEDAGPLAHPVRPALYHEINNFYTATVYEKGAEVVRMLKVLLGPENFRKGMDLYFSRHDGQAATVEQFVQCFADVSSTDLTQFMLWYSQAGTPEVVATGSYDARAKSYRLELAQSIPPTPGQPSKQPMVVPLAVSLVGREGRDLPLKLDDGRTVERGVLTLTKSVETFVFADVAEQPVASLNRGFSAPIKLSANLSADDLRFLAAHDADPFNRWQALQTLATRLLLDNTAASRASRPARHDPGLLDALGATLADGALEPAFVALALTLPGEAEIAREIGHDVDPDAVFAARAALRAAVGEYLAGPLFDHYRRLSESGPYRPDAASAGRRMLRNTCLDLLVATQQPEAISLAARQYQAADNMTDRMAALSALSLCDVPERAVALDDFYARYADDPLIVDKWLTLQATVPEPATLDRVRALTSHRAFSFANPNRVRALIHAFALANQKEFNRADGAGYDFIVYTVLALDPKNPQLAARLVSGVKNWRMLEPVRREHAEAALRRVATAPSLSPDVDDIVRRTLAKD